MPEYPNTLWTGRRRIRWWVIVLPPLLLAVTHFSLMMASPQYAAMTASTWIREYYLGQESVGMRRITREDGRVLLWDGVDPDAMFDITTFDLDPRRLKYGIGREAFPALYEPRFVSGGEVSGWLEDEARVLAVSIAGETRVYPLRLLMQHEVVNDEIDGIEFFAAFCVLADLGAVYQRQYGEHALTFALSGYTYSEPDIWEGMDAFVLWDRETESLWWPLHGRAVSGPLHGTPLQLLDEAYWSQTTWGEVREADPDAIVLRGNQRMTVPSQWPMFDEQTIEQVQEDGPAELPPRWRAAEGDDRGRSQDDAADERS